MAAQGALRRWKPFYGAFSSIHAAIEAADPDVCRNEFRRTTSDIVELLCDAADDGQAERLCGILDEVMAEALETLRLVPAMPKMLASTDLAKAVGDLRQHNSERVRLLASSIMSSWKAAVQDDLDKARAATEKQDQTPQVMKMKIEKRPAKILESPEKKTSSILGYDRANTSKVAGPSLPKNKVSVAGSDNATMEGLPSASKKAPPAIGTLRGDRAVRPCSDDAKRATTKRKLREGYQEAENVKRHRTSRQPSRRRR